MMNKKIFKIILTICKGYWLAVILKLVLDISQAFVGNYAFVAFQQLLDGFPTAHHLTDMAPLLAWYIGRMC